MLATHHADIKRIILPKANEKDLKDVPQDIRENLTVILVEKIEEVLPAIFIVMLWRMATSAWKSHCPNFSVTDWTPEQHSGVLGPPSIVLQVSEKRSRHNSSTLP